MNYFDYMNTPQWRRYFQFLIGMAVFATLWDIYYWESDAPYIPAIACGVLAVIVMIAGYIKYLNRG
jgi:hypothetical protein